MNIKNYTSGVPVERTVARIEQVLAKAGVRGIQKEYDASANLTALQFVLDAGRPITIRLPVDVEAVRKRMNGEVRRPRTGTRERISEQACRTAWKLMQDWVEVQLSLISMQQVEWLQVFLPYVWDDSSKVDFYHMLKDRQFKSLPGIGGTGS